MGVPLLVLVLFMGSFLLRGPADWRPCSTSSSRARTFSFPFGLITAWSGSGYRCSSCYCPAARDRLGNGASLQPILAANRLCPLDRGCRRHALSPGCGGHGRDPCNGPGLNDTVRAQDTVGSGAPGCIIACTVSRSPRPASGCGRCRGSRRIRFPVTRTSRPVQSASRPSPARSRQGSARRADPSSSPVGAKRLARLRCSTMPGGDGLVSRLGTGQRFRFGRDAGASAPPARAEAWPGEPKPVHTSLSGPRVTNGRSIAADGILEPGS